MLKAVKMPVANGEVRHSPVEQQNQAATNQQQAGEPEEVRPRTQTDVLNKNLLTAFLRRINDQTAQEQASPQEVGENQESSGSRQ